MPTVIRRRTTDSQTPHSIGKRTRGLRAGVRRTRRLQDIAGVLIKYGLSDWIRGLRLHRAVPGIRALLTRRNRPVGPIGANRWERVRLALEELGPTFVKLGQLLSNRTDVLPAGLSAEISKLQDRAQSVPWDEIRPTLDAELAGERSSIFSSLEETPVAAASIAQVHRGVLADGSEVAVKIQRPGIREIISLDLEILAYLAKLAERYIPAARYLGPIGLVEEFRRTMAQEVDFTREQQNMERFLANHEKRADLHVPKTFPEHSTEKLLIMEYVHGTKISSMDRLTSPAMPEGFDRSIIAERAADMMLEQILVYGYYHADPHPGNIMVLPQNIVCFLDFGQMGHLNASDRRQLVAAINGVVKRDGERVTDAILQLTGADPDDEYRPLVNDIQEMVDAYLDRPLKDVNIAELLGEIIRGIVNHGLRVPSNLLMVAKALLTIEAVGMNLDPNFTSQPALESIVKRLMMSRLDPRTQFEGIASTLYEYAGLLEELPKATGDVLRQLRTGRLTMGFRLRDLEPLRRTLDNIGYRLIFGVVLAAIMISSALIVHARVPPLWNGVSLIGVIGFGLAGVLGVGFLGTLAVRVFRHDR